MPDITNIAPGQTRFFSDSSPWNTPVPSNAATTEPGGVDAIADRGWIGLSSWDATSSSIAIYYATTADPIESVKWVADSWLPVNSGEWRRTGNSAAVEQRILSEAEDINSYPVNTYSTQRASQEWNRGGAAPTSQYDEWVQTEPLRVHVPAGATPPSDGDGSMVVIQPDGRALELYSPVVLSDGTLVSQMFTFTDAVDGSGTGADNGRRASMVPVYAGAITDLDVRSGDIDHALALLVPPSLLETAYVSPALAIDSNPGYSGSIPMGGRLVLPASADIASLGIDTPLGRMVAEAAQEYGMYAVERGGSGITIATQLSPSESSLQRYSQDVQDDLSAIFEAARLVTPDGLVWA